MSDLILEKLAVSRAVDLVRPMILAMMQNRSAKRSDLHIAVAVPRTEPKFRLLYEESIGEKSCWEAPLDEIARSKTEISWRTGKSSSYIHACAPHLVHDDDTIFWGSDVLDELVTGCSGVEPYYDEMFAGTINLAIRAVCKGYHIERVAGLRGMKAHFMDASTGRKK